MKSKTIILTMVILLSTLVVSAQKYNVNGTVTDADDGSRIVGVNVIIKGTTTGTITDIDGQYNIMVEPGETLMYSSMGYKPQEIVVKEQKQINVFMERDFIFLNEMVVIGYGSTKKSDLTGSIVSLKSDELAERPVSSVDYALQGKAAGVQVSNTSGRPGSGASIRIRGHGSLLTNNSPLWIIDGFIDGDINSIAPEDIESIEILKDASSTAIYGSRGGNGVIMVTTKRGKKNHNNISFSYYHQLSQVSNKLNLLDREGYTSLRNRALTADGLSEQFTAGQIDGSEPINGYIANTDWQDEIFRVASVDYFNLSASGGGDKTTYALSLNHRGENGIIYDSDFSRNGIRLNLDHEINDRMKLGVNANVYRTETNGFNVTTEWSLGAAGGAITAFPYYPLYDDEGEYFNLSSWDNPRLQAEGQDDNTIRTNLLGSVFFSWEIINDLIVKADFSGDYRNYKNNQFVTSKLFGATDTRGLARASISNILTDKWIGSLTATYSKEVAENHHVNALIGVEQQVVSSVGSSMTGEDIARESFLWHNMTAFDQANHSISSSIYGYVTKSIFGRIQYNYLGRYLVQATVRKDGSSKFGPSEKWGTFPSASVAWKLSEEDFISDMGIFDLLKLRLSWGISGNDNIDLYQWLPRMAVGTNNSNALFGSPGGSGGDAELIGASIGQIPNESVHWEESNTINIGMDMNFFQNRYRLTMDLYDRTTSELLWDYPLPLYTGYGDGWTSGVSVVSNIAEMNNKGIEFSVEADILVNGNFKWTTGLNISKNINKVVDLAGGNEVYAGITKIVEGEPIGNIWGYKTDGIFQEGDDVENTPRFTGDEGVGDQRYLDANDNGVLTDEDMGVIGNALPDFVYGMSNTFSYKQFELLAVINGVQGVDLYNGSLQTLSDGTLGEHNGGAWLLDSWTPENTNTDIPRVTDSYVDKTSDRFVEDASFVRLSNVQLSYFLPDKVAKKLKMKHLKVYMSMQNFLTLTKYSGYDPEMYSEAEANSGDNSNLSLGYDSQNYPSSKSITFGIQLGL